MPFKIYTLITLLILFFQEGYAIVGLSPVTAQKDSVGVERVDGEMYILHQVSQGETLFSLSRKYATEVTALRSSNPAINVDDLGIGDTLRVPLFPQFTQGKKTIHTVKEGETLYRLSKQYDASISDIKKWNALTHQPLAIGQAIVIYHVERTAEANQQDEIDEKKYVVHTVMQGETLFAISRAYDVPVRELMQRNKLPDERIAFGQKLIIREREVIASPELPVTASTTNTPTIPEPITSREEEEDDEEEVYDRRLTRAEALEQEKQRIRAIRAAEKKAMSDYEKKAELGFAAAIEGGIETQKFLALHRSAPVGTIIQIRNEMNNLSVFVRVVGKLPDTGVNEKVSIRISKAAYEKLGGINERFPVEITYIQ
jgi:LysM repeat protein